MTSIAIVGSGVSGLHLGLFLQQHDVPVTLYSDKTADQIASGRLLNTVAHHHHTLERERELGVHHWDASEYGYVCHHHAIVGTPEPMRWRGDFQHPSSIIDYRLYLPRLLQDYEERGGDVVIGPVDTEMIERISAGHVVGLLMAMAENKAVCDAYTQNFNHPDRQWDTVATPERAAAFIARHAAGQPAVAA
jgi:glycine/D-amino acid oxidase-like deaminating enzyme